MRMQKRKFRIGELAKHLEVERFVIRFWEKEFELKTDRSTGGQRFYDEEDLNIFKNIKTLLYSKGFTIPGAKKQLESKHSDIIIASKKTDINYNDSEVALLKNKLKLQKKEFTYQLLQLRKQLHELQKLI